MEQKLKLILAGKNQGQGRKLAINEDKNVSILYIFFFRSSQRNLKLLWISRIIVN